MSDCMQRPSCMLKNSGDVYKQIATGLVYQPQQKTDFNVDPEVRAFTFRGQQPFGFDLIATDIMRARDHGLPTYNEMREFCGLPKIHNWNDLSFMMLPQYSQTLQQFYSSVDDLELTLTAALEYKLSGSLVGPTFSCILAYQFNALREGDRFFYENGATQSGCEFTLAQLAEIKKESFAKLFCNNVPGLTQIQKRAFELISDTNPLMNCTHLPDIDYSKWQNFGC